MKFRQVMWLVGLLVLGAGSAVQAADCSTQIPSTVFSKAQVFAAGSAWSLSFGRNPCEGLVLLYADFTPKGGTARRVLYRGSIAQVHVPYQPGSPRFRDIGVSTAGMGANAVVLAASECPGGTLYDGGRICVAVEDRGFAWKYGTTSQRGEALSIFMSSQLGRYNYINMWNFQDDGTIEVRTGLTGRLQLVNSGDQWLPYGSRLNAESAATPLVGLNHQHNIYYRLDFDIGGGADNAVSNLSLQPSVDPSPSGDCSALGQCFVIQENQLLNEGVDFLSPGNFTSWRVYNKAQTNANGRPIGYELVPSVRGIGYGMNDTTEPWALGELWVTRFDPCHLLATDNHPPLIPASCAGTADNVTDMVAGGGDIDGQDIVLWYANRFTHFTREEDQVNMPTEWLSFELQPRGFTAHSPLEP